MFTNSTKLCVLCLPEKAAYIGGREGLTVSSLQEDGVQVLSRVLVTTDNLKPAGTNFGCMPLFLEPCSQLPLHPDPNSELSQSFLCRSLLHGRE